MQNKQIALFVLLLIIIALFLLSSCRVGPDYNKPEIVDMPNQFQEAGMEWQLIQPNDSYDRGQWWKIFANPELDDLEYKLNINNQNIIGAAASYKQALALVDKARSSYFPTITGDYTFTRSKSSNSKANNLKVLSLTASWEPDIWGGVARTVEASKADADAAKAVLALTRLSAQSSLAQYYFELRSLDIDQAILDEAVQSYQQILDYTLNRQKVGVASQDEVLQADSNLQAAKALATNNGINRAQYQHAIAVLIGQPPSSFTILPQQIDMASHDIPLLIPSSLLERRPDIAQAERLAAAANAQIGVAKAAYYPNLILPATGSFEGTMKGLFSLPNYVWSVGPTLAATLFDGGLRSSTTKAAQENYKASIANYRQTVLAAFQDVEDSLVSVKMLGEQYQISDKAAQNAAKSFEIATNQYNSGIIDLSALLSAKLQYLQASKTAKDTLGLRISYEIGLIKSLGGSWGEAAKSD